MHSRLPWILCVAAIAATGIASRAIHTGFSLFDKYLGDALYAAMVYAVLRASGIRQATRAALTASLLMVLIEWFQLTGIPIRWHKSGSLVLRLCARLTGTTFGWLDLAAYAAGIAGVFAFDYRKPR